MEKTIFSEAILDVRRAACQSVGALGDRYTCRIQGMETYLWFEKGRCFISARTGHPLYSKKKSS